MAKFHSEQTHRSIDRIRSAEAKMKALKAENVDLRKQLFRAQESARLANEETTARIAAHKQSSAAARANAEVLRADLDLWKREAEALHAAATTPRAVGLFERIASRLRSPA